MRFLLLVSMMLFSGIAIGADTLVFGDNGVVRHTGLMGVFRPDANTRFWSPRLSDGPIPDAYDSRDEGYVTDIKDQGSCGSCWAFSMTKSFEAASLNSRRATPDMSEQDILVNDRQAYGCNGGFMNGHYIVDHGLATEQDCPYRASTRYRCNKPVAGKATGWAFIGARGRAPTVAELKAAIFKFKVISVTVSAGSGWSDPPAGNLTRCRNRGVNHMVNLVGYKADDTFIMANSWGANWADDGFAYIKRGCDQLASTAQSALAFSVDL